MVGEEIRIFTGFPAVLQTVGLTLAQPYHTFKEQWRKVRESNSRACYRSFGFQDRPITALATFHLVATTGIEPVTQGFSVPRSTY